MTWLAVSVASWALYAGRQPPSAIFMTRACGSVVEVRASGTGLPRLAWRFFVASISGRWARAWRTRSARSLAARSRAAATRRELAAGSSSSSALSAADLGLGLGEEAFEPVSAAIAGGTCGSPNPDAVLGDRVKGHEAVGQERRDALCQEPVQNVGVLDPEGRQGVVVEADAAGEPAVCVVLGAQPVECPGRADALRVSHTATAPQESGGRSAAVPDGLRSP